jgi:hypothetical protein
METQISNLFLAYMLQAQECKSYHIRGPVKLRNVIANCLHNEQLECEQDGDE